ncbi:MAG TPA: bifunctional diaminohydroxyphosphoribosylaminopyrimidine deaminase/5-amino-6-(5-phosphoribosylamino)uracil reductase RibD [Bacteroidales bacterium]|nr:bifunctional diaminohydroxyphosphoribosylaminopyrimidine deaminase/5-amino-6-(5-phosphoribosylamino)uracil reductase RibD [Bacteroidales bacterium]
MDNKDEIYIKRCLQLAEYGRGSVSPNPMVGCVIVYKDRIIGEGFHRKYGEAHAEVHAINSVKEKSLLAKSTLYVNLEPCSHHGKTPPCSDLIISKNIPRVVLASTDPNPLVAGNGIKKLQDAGISVTQGVLNADAEFFNRRFYTFYKKKRPYIILKYAKSADGFIDHERTKKHPHPAWITNDYCKMLVHKWRTEEDAFMVGTRTVMLDNPQLTARMWPGKNPLRISLDEFNVIEKTVHLLDNSTPTLIFTSEKKTQQKNIDFEKINFTKSVVQQILDVLYKRKIQSLVVEGGHDLLQSFIDENMWDEARVFTGDIVFGKGTPEPVLNGVLQSVDYFGNSELRIFYPALA